MRNDKKVFIINGQDCAKQLSGDESDVAPESDGWVGSKTLMEAVAEFTKGKKSKKTKKGGE